MCTSVQGALHCARSRYFVGTLFQLRDADILQLFARVYRFTVCKCVLARWLPAGEQYAVAFLNLLPPPRCYAIVEPIHCRGGLSHSLLGPTLRSILGGKKRTDENPIPYTPANFELPLDTCPVPEGCIDSASWWIAPTSMYKLDRNDFKHSEFLLASSITSRQ